MAVRRSAALIVAALSLAGCSKQGDATPVAPACLDGAPVVARALGDAPGEVRLEDGTALSACIETASTAADLQTVGGSFTSVAEDLEERAFAKDARAALELGYLVGAARRGAGDATALQAELVRRLERSADVDGASPAVAGAIARGMAAGEARG
jgi:hypothetical protein